MAFITPYSHNGFTYPEAYCKAIVAYCDSKDLAIHVLVYADINCREGKFEPITKVQHILPSDLDAWQGNPVEGAYQKLEASQLYPAATWNV
jgi:hypothetical protein